MVKLIKQLSNNTATTDTQNNTQKDWGKRFNEKWEDVMQYSDDFDSRRSDSPEARQIKLFIQTLLEEQNRLEIINKII